MKPGEFILGLGANLGARLASLRAARELLAREPGIQVQRCSRVYETPPLGPPQPDYLNAALLISTVLSPDQLWERLAATEEKLGRVRRERWGPRNLDIDILDGSDTTSAAGLKIPHPELRSRPFALAPLADIDAERARFHGYRPETEPDVVFEQLDSDIAGTQSNMALSGTGRGPFDACVEALSALKGASMGKEILVLPADSMVDGCQRLLENLAEGRSFGFLTLTEAPDHDGIEDRIDLRLFGVSEGATPTPLLRVRSLELERDAAGVHHAKVTLASQEP